MDDFKLTTLIVQWGCKIMADLKAKEKVDRLPILVSSMGTSKLLGAPKIDAERGQAQAQAMVSLLKKWYLEDTVRGLCFDTTASNTGRSDGAVYARTDRESDGAGSPVFRLQAPRERAGPRSSFQGSARGDI